MPYGFIYSVILSMESDSQSVKPYINAAETIDSGHYIRTTVIQTDRAGLALNSGKPFEILERGREGGGGDAYNRQAVNLMMSYFCL